MTAPRTIHPLHEPRGDVDGLIADTIVVLGHVADAVRRRGDDASARVFCDAAHRLGQFRRALILDREEGCAA